MNLLWPEYMLALLLVPGMILLYIWILRRRKRYAVRFSSLSLIRSVLPKQSWLRRHLPFSLFLLAIISLVFAMTRPIYQVQVPIDKATIILAIDVSRSMRQRDVWPSRLEAAKQAALSFVASQDPRIQIGVVAFSGFGQTVQTPTNDQKALRLAIESLTLGRGTGIGNGLLESLNLLAEVEGLMPATGGNIQGGLTLLPGTYSPYIIVLLTDGVNTTGPMPLDAAREAVLMGIRTYTIGFGTPIEAVGSQSGPNQQSPGNSQFQGFFRRGLDETTLKMVAEMTGGEYYSAESAGDLEAVFNSLPTNLITRIETTEISVTFAALGALLAAAAIWLSLVWHPLP